MIKYLQTKGAFAEVDHNHFRDERLRDAGAALATRETLKRTRKDIMVIVSCILGAALVLPWLLLAWKP